MQEFRYAESAMLCRRRVCSQPLARALAIASFLLLLPMANASDATPTRLSFEELIQLSQQDQLDPALQAKMDAILTTPVVRNRPVSAGAGRAADSLLVTEWNIERGENLDGIFEMLKSPDSFLKKAQKQSKKPLSRSELTRLRAQADRVRRSDVLILNEVDTGVKRTDYRDVTDELARALHMSSAYAVEFLEVDSLTELGTETAVLETPALSERMTADLKPDRSRFQGLHGNAILSRYPLRNVHIISLPVCHDWYADEKKEISQLERGKRKAASVAFLERISREVRRGNRNTLVADVEIPGGPPQPVRIVNAHLENKCKADCRNRQMKKVLEEISDTTGPLVLAGDLNTTGTDGTPTSVRYELMSRVKDYQFWIGTLMRFTPVGLPIYATTPFNFWKNFRDPTALHIPVIGRNPEAAMFTNLRKFKFADGTQLDFAGDAGRNLERSGKTLSDSNQRATKGFAPTFSMQRDFGGVIRYRLDWMFVKPTDAEHTAFFRPQTPLTFTELNNALAERLSDHAPVTVDLPLRLTTGPRSVQANAQ